jgi:thioester reductase-like protein
VRLDKLIQLLHTVHGKQREFTAELVAILQREALLQHVNLSKSNSNLIEEKEKLEKKFKATDVRLESSKVDCGKTEQLRKEYDLKVAALDKCELHIDKLQGELKDAREQAEQLQSAADSNSQVGNLQQALTEEIERTTQLKTALESKQQYIEKIEGSSLEANNTLEEKIKESEKYVLALKQDNHTLQNKNVSLQKELDSLNN